MPWKFAENKVMDFSGLTQEWLNLLLRWVHMIIGIGWIGASFYFVWLDLSFKKRDRMNPGVSGTTWMVHGGGFYHVEKFLVAPAHLPEDLHWFKWEAYLTWVTGFALLIVQYYWNASSYLIDPSVYPLVPWQAVWISLSALLFGWLLYDGLCRLLRDNTWALALCTAAMIIIASYLFSLIFSGRGALIHVGALTGTMMAANVFAVIIPNQRIVTADLLAGRTPDPGLLATAKQRSMHNNYLTLPVLLMMVSNHYPLLTGHPQKWLLVALIFVVGAGVRHFINEHDAGRAGRIANLALAGAALGLAAAVVVTSIRPSPAELASEASDAQVTQILATHCVSCHAARPTHEAFTKPPANLRLESLPQLAAAKVKVQTQAVRSKVMPLGNQTGMSDEERAILGAWLAAR